MPKNTFQKPFADIADVLFDGINTSNSSNSICSYVYTFTPIRSVSNPRFTFAHHRMNGSNGEISNDPPITIHASYTISASLTGTVTELTFDSANHTTLNCGDFYESDAGAQSLTAGIPVLVRISVTGTTWGTDIDYPYFNPNTAPGVDYVLSSSTTAYNGYTRVFRHVAITGDLATPEPSIVILGDSIAEGWTGNNAYGGGTGGAGFIVNRLAAANKLYLRYSCPGESGAEFLAASPFRLAMARHATYVLGEYGTNDLRSGVSASAIESMISGIVTAIGAVPGGVDWCTIVPNSNSTDGWATTANQSDPDQAQLNWPVRQAVNTALLATPSPYGLRRVWNSGQAAASMLLADTWRPAGTGDGIHPSSAVHDSMSIAIDASTYSQPTAQFTDTDPGAANVKTGVAYSFGGQTKTGTYTSQFAVALVQKS